MTVETFVMVKEDLNMWSSGLRKLVGVNMIQFTLWRPMADFMNKINFFIP